MRIHSHSPLGAWTRRIWAACLGLLLTLQCAAAGTVYVFAAASLGNVMADIGAAFEAQSQHKVVVSLAGTPTLARQIEQGAPADIFISANPAWMSRLEAEGLLSPASRRAFLSNDLVLIGPKGAAPMPLTAPADVQARLSSGPIAMAFVNAVPAGIYGRQALTHLGVWVALQPFVVETDSVRAALALVALGEAPFGIVYATDALADARVSEVARFPSRSHDPVEYSLALVGPKPSSAATAFYDFLSTDAVWNLLERAGFSKAAQP